MKLKLVMSDAETGEVLHEATDLTFAMMCFAQEDGAGLNYKSRIATDRISAYGYAKCLEQVHNSATKAVKEAPQIVQGIALYLSRDALVNLVNDLAKAVKDDAAGEGAAEKKEEAAE